MQYVIDSCDHQICIYARVYIHQLSNLFAYRVLISLSVFSMCTCQFVCLRMYAQKVLSSHTGDVVTARSCRGSRHTQTAYTLILSTHTHTHTHTHTILYSNQL